MKHVRTGMGAGILLLALGLTGVMPTEAQAAQCNAPGNRIGVPYILYSPALGAPIGTLEVYYSKKNGGTNSACLHYQGAAVGQSLRSIVTIERCSSYYHCDKVNYNAGDQDQGVFTQYAGPVSVTGTRRRCVHVRGLLQDPYDKNQSVSIELSGIGCEATPSARYRFFGSSRQQARQNESRNIPPPPGVPVPVEVVDIPTNPPSGVPVPVEVVDIPTNPPSVESPNGPR